MESTAPTSSKVAFKWAIIYIVTSIVLTYVFQFLNIGVSSPIRYFTFIFFIAFMFLGQKEYRDGLGGFATFGQAFVEGLLFSVFAGVLLAIFTYINYSFISPHEYEQILSAQKEKLDAQGTLSSEQIDAAMAITKKYGVLITAISILIITPIIGAIISLVGAAIFKKERSILDIEQNNDFTDPAV